VGQQLVSKAQYDQAIAERDALRAELATARRNAEVAADSLHIADIGVDNTIVRAPFSGVITTKDAQPGEIVSPLSAGGGFTRTGICTVVDMDSLEIEVEVGEAFIGRVKPKMRVEATLNAYPDWKIPAEVIAIIPTADRGKATVTVRVALKKKDPRIVPEMGVNVSFLDAEAERPSGPAPRPTVRVPTDAVVEHEGGDVVFVVAGEDGDRAERRALKLGRPLGDGREVLSGLSAGETVVLDPPAELQDGGKIREAEEDGSN
jgi:RND family efflux transporter MFP subunit